MSLRFPQPGVQFRFVLFAPGVELSALKERGGSRVDLARRGCFRRRRHAVHERLVKVAGSPNSMSAKAFMPVRI